GILSASVLSVISLIRPYQWQSLLMPVWYLLLYDSCKKFLEQFVVIVLPNDMHDFLDAPVPYIVRFSNFLLFLKHLVCNMLPAESCIVSYFTLWICGVHFLCFNTLKATLLPILTVLSYADGSFSGTDNYRIF
ncbi:hypothetical protein IFM89_015313, partial [Coptis chinensis]